MIALLIALAIQTATPVTIEAMPPAYVRVVSGSVAVKHCADRWCHPDGFLFEGQRSGVRAFALVDGVDRVLTDAGWLYCHRPEGPANYEIISNGVLIAECADYGTD